ncbi:hypothetical protein GCM10010885_19740 [Alicyclobacillus cellulosilyticus]|uniref:Uncharacterized protein n=1 Tax=Alicyclobacillus cellulosilyticus TaxID=1003997 RepID=A0A917KDV6_9BACL|nr:hypothetical protein GCM10010885_19740 [Alicyclobacillus cellulosilyticus]
MQPVPANGCSQRENEGDGSFPPLAPQDQAQAVAVAAWEKRRNQGRWEGAEADASKAARDKPRRFL